MGISRCRGLSDRARGARTLAGICLGLGLCMLTGCVQVRDHLTLEPDGSGTVTLETRLLVESQNIMMMRLSGPLAADSPRMAYPPLTEADLEKVFPGDAFTIEQSETVREGEGLEPGQFIYRAAVAFEDVHALLQSPYAEVHTLTMKKEGGRLVLQASTGMAGFTALDQQIADNELDLPVDNEAVQKQLKALKCAFSVTLPGAVQAQGVPVQGNTATYVVDRAQIQDARKTFAALQRALRVTCPADAAGFEPPAIARIPLGAYGTVEPGPIGRAPDPIDIEAVRRAMRFTPIALVVTRTFDLGGYEYGGGENHTVLYGAVHLSPEHKPQRWGPLELTVARDDLGDDLRPVEDEAPYRAGMMHGLMAASEAEAEGHHLVTVSLKAPSREARSLARLAGTIDAYYPGQAHVVKLDEVIQEADVSEQGEQVYIYPTGEDAVDHPTLDRLGYRLQFQNVMRQFGLNMVMFSQETEQASLADLRIYNADGRALPTLLGLGPGYMGEDTKMALVLGRIQPPLSVALLIRGGGAKVSVPVSLEDVSLYDEQAPGAGGQEQ